MPPLETSYNNDIAMAAPMDSEKPPSYEESQPSYPQQARRLYSQSDKKILSEALGIHPAYVVDHPENLTMWERDSLVGDQFHVTNEGGQEIVTVNAKRWSTSHRKEILSPSNDLLFTLRKRRIEIPQSFYLEDSEGKEVVEIERGWSLGPNLDIKFSNRLSLRGPAPVTLQMRGDWNDRGADIWWNDLRVAGIHRYPENRRGLSSRHTYGIEVAARVESSLIIAIVAAIDESNRTNHSALYEHQIVKHNR